jgi:hypothetical protein
MPKVKELEPMVANGAAHGYRPAPSRRRVTPDLEKMAHLAPADGLEPFWADIDGDLTIAEQRAIPVTGPWQPILEQIAPRILAWNAGAVNPDTGEWELLPPPAEAGWQVLEQVSQHVVSFLVLALKFGSGSDLPKGRTPANGTRDG